MLLNHTGSYYEDYKRSKSVKASVSKEAGNERLLTDRSAYISFLEVQLERVSAACMTSQGFSERIEQVHAEVVSLREKSNNLAKKVTSTQGNCDAESERSSQRLNEFNEKLKVISSELSECMNELSSARLAMSHVRKIPAEIERQRQEEMEALKHRLENTFMAAIGDRVDVMQARLHATEAKVKDIDNIAKAETQSALDSMESRLSIAIDTVNEQGASRSRQVESKLSSEIQQVREDLDKRLTALEVLASQERLSGAQGDSKPPALTKKLREENMLLRRELDTLQKDMKKELSTVSRSCTILVNKVQTDLEEQKRQFLKEIKREMKLYIAELLKNPAVFEQVKRANSSIKANEVTAMPVQNSYEEAKQGCESDELRSEAPIREKAPNKLQHQASLEPALQDHLEKRLEALLTNRLNKSTGAADLKEHIDSKLEAVNGKLAEQSSTVAESMKKIEEFLTLYNRTKKELKSTLKRGQKHQENLHNLVERANTDIIEATSPFARAQTYSDEEDCDNERHRRRRLLKRSESAIRSKSVDSLRTRSRSSRRTGGGKRGRGRTDSQDDEMFGMASRDGNARYLASQLRSSERTGSAQRPPWNSCRTHPSRVESKIAESSKTKCIVKKIRKNKLKPKTKRSLLKDFAKLEKSRQELEKLYEQMNALT